MRRPRPGTSGSRASSRRRAATSAADQLGAEARRAEVIGHVNAISKNLKENHVSYMIYFRGWEELGALRVRSAGACAHVAGLWDERAEAFCLVTEDVSDGLYLDYTDPDQLNGDDEYELWAWGAFLRLK